MHLIKFLYLLSLTQIFEVHSLLPPGKPETGKIPDHELHEIDVVLRDLQFLTKIWLLKMPLFKEKAKCSCFYVLKVA